jgi:hypothetical protein
VGEKKMKKMRNENNLKLRKGKISVSGSVVVDALVPDAYWAALMDAVTVY